MNQFRASETGAAKQQKLCAAYDKYKAGEMDRNEYAMVLLTVADGYIKWTIKSSHTLVHAQSFEDLYQNARLCILERIDSYDPHQSMISTFFKYPLMDALRDPGCAKATVSLPPEFGMVRSKLQKAAEALGYERDDDGLKKMAANETASMLSTLTGVDTKAIQNTISRLGLCEIASTSNIGEDYGDPAYESPEQSYERKELSEHVQAALSRLTPFERYLMVYEITPESEKPTPKAMIGILNDPDSPTHRLFADEIPDDLTKVRLAQKIAEVKRKMMRFPEMRNAAAGRYASRVDYSETYEQADADSISITIQLDNVI
jgi:DNA-directed RNA polymerase specialized sigma subunit